MSTLAIIPARYQSSRFPGKPLADIAGKTMIHRVYERCKTAFDYVIVATDDKRIEDEVTSFSGESVMTSQNHPNGTSRVLEAYQIYCKSHPDISIDLIINIQGDEPLISPKQLSSLEQTFADPKVELATLVKKIENNEELFDSNTPKVIIDNSSYALYFSRSTIPYLRDYEKTEWLKHHTFYKHIGLYAYRPHILAQIVSMAIGNLEKAESLEQLRWLENGLKIKVVETDYESVSVDLPSDIEKVLANL